MAASLGLSLLLHVLLILLYPLLSGAPDAGRTRSPAATEAPRPAGTEIVRIAEVPGDQVERPEEPEREREPVPVPPRARPVAPGAADEPEPGEPSAEEGLSAAERVRATAPDVRLVAPLSEGVVALSPQQIAQLELVWALEHLNDSAAAMAEAARRATDWTFTDSEGKRWGLSPDGLHLGDVTIPMPSFGAPYDPNAWKGSVAADLERAAAGSAARDTQEDRAKAIRERKDRERRERADTSRSGGR